MYFHFPFLEAAFLLVSFHVPFWGTLGIPKKLKEFPDGETYFRKVIYLHMENGTFRKIGLKSGSQDTKKATGRPWF